MKTESTESDHRPAVIGDEELFERFRQVMRDLKVHFENCDICGCVTCWHYEAACFGIPIGSRGW